MTRFIQEIERRSAEDENAGIKLASRHASLSNSLKNSKGQLNYILWLLAELGTAGYLLDEMNLN